jgi:hypothetical protein
MNPASIGLESVSHENDQKLVAVVEELGAGANGLRAHLKIVSIPSDVKWKIQARHGIELVSEAHRTWN